MYACFLDTAVTYLLCQELEKELTVTVSSAEETVNKKQRSQQPNENVFRSHLNHWQTMSACHRSSRRLFRTCSCKHLSPQ